MADIPRKTVSRGERLRIPAEVLTDMFELSAWWSAQKTLSQQGIDVGTNEQIEIKNVSGQVLQWFGVVGVDSPIVSPNVSLAGFMATKGLKSAAPAPGEPFAILQSAAGLDLIVNAAMSGETWVLVDVSDVADGFAQPIADDYTKLASTGLAASAEIVWKDIPEDTALAGAILAADTTLIVVSSVGFQPPCVVTIEDEDILVMNIDRTTNAWAVTRAQNGTTAADHADGETVTFKSGVVWAMVRLGSTAAEEDNLALILTIDMLHMF